MGGSEAFSGKASSPGLTEGRAAWRAVVSSGQEQTAVSPSSRDAFQANPEKVVDKAGALGCGCPEPF